MNPRYFFTSLTRISNLPDVPFSTGRLPRHEWATGDYVVGEVVSGGFSRVELASGRMAEVGDGDLVVGAFGVRYATLEAVGGWQNIGNDRAMEALTAAGLFGRCTSRSTVLAPLLPLSYKGHVLLADRKATMRGCAAEAPGRPFGMPVVLLVGTSMSAGKTTTARTIVRLLAAEGLTVVGAKLTGAGRYRDILAMEDAGAERVFDFVDSGLPSTVVREGEYREALRGLLSRIAGTEADVLVAEVGASPLEPYNGTTAIEEISPNVRCTVLAASDPYAVTGVTAAFGRRADLVTGLATSTRAGIELVEKLSGIPALNVLDRGSLPKLRSILERSLRGRVRTNARPEMVNLAGSKGQFGS